MRTSRFASGLFLLLFGVILLSSSGISIKPEPILTRETVTEERYTSSRPLESYSVKGNLTREDQFRVTFTLGVDTIPFIEGFGVDVNITDPMGNTKNTFVRLVQH